MTNIVTQTWNPGTNWPGKRATRWVQPSAAKPFVGTWLPFAVGFALPLISFQTGSSYRAETLWERLTVVDILTILAFVCAAIVGKLAVRSIAMFYGSALFAGFGIAALNNLVAGESLRVSAIESIALAVAFLYWIVGFNIAGTRSLRPLVIGIACGVFLESVIVIHDWLSANRWFVDNMEGRVRGTFRKNGQLAAYGFSVSGILLTIGISVERSSRWRTLLVIGGLLGILFLIAASRRSALFAVFSWIACYAVLAGPRSRHLAYYVTVFAFVVGGFLGFVYREVWIDTLFGTRVLHGVERLASLEGDFLFEQVVIALSHWNEWIPFGMGIGRGRLLMDGLEFHNLYLALIVEIGVLGLFAFLALVVTSFRTLLNAMPKGSMRPWVISFFFAAALFGVHNRLHRDRTFMLFLGIAAGLPAVRNIYNSKQDRVSTKSRI